MKTALISLLTATVLGFASLVSGRSFDAADFVAIAFVTGLVAWTVNQYDRDFKTLNLAKPIRFPANSVNRHSGMQVGRLAA